MRNICGIAVSVAAMLVLARGAAAEPVQVGALTEVRQNVYGVPPEGREAAKHKGDAVAFQEALETLEDSGALIRFIDDSKLTMGAKSKVLIDAFVFDPNHVQGNALINISVGTLRFVTGQMPKGGVVITTPTATLTLRGTDVVVHVHPDGTTDTTVKDGKVEAYNKVTNQVTNLVPGDSATLGEGGTTRFDHDEDPNIEPDLGSDQANGLTPEHRRGDSMQAQRPETPEPTGSGSDSGASGADSSGDSGGYGGDDGGDCGCT